MKQDLLTIALLSNLVACVAGDNTEPSTDVDNDDDAAQPIAFPKSCAEAAQGVASPADGERTLYIAGDQAKPWQAYCADMSTKLPLEYLTLQDNGDFTWSSYTAGGRAPGVDVVTRFSKVRIDPSALKIDVSDLRFARSEGSITHIDGSIVKELPLGVAMTCGGGFATSNVDVQGTPFELSEEWTKAGDAGHLGNAGIWPSNDVMEIWAEGDCGWTAPTLISANPLAITTRFALTLKYTK